MRSARSLSAVSGLTAGERRWRIASGALKAAAIGLAAGAAVGYVGEKTVGKLTRGRGISSGAEVASKTGASELSQVTDATVREPVRESLGSIAHGRGFVRADDYALTLAPGDAAQSWRISSDDFPVGTGKVFSLEQPNGTTVVFFHEHLQEKTARELAAQFGREVPNTLGHYRGDPVLRDSIGTNIRFTHGIVVPGPAEGLKVPQALIDRGVAEARAASISRHLWGGSVAEGAARSRSFAHTGELGKLIEPERLRLVKQEIGHQLEYLIDGAWVPWFRMP